MNRPDIVVTKRQGLVFVCFVAVLRLALVAIFNSPVDPAIKNQREVIHLLTRARPEPTSAISFQIERVTLAIASHSYSSVSKLQSGTL
jgi:hypothetical protein